MTTSEIARRPVSASIKLDLLRGDDEPRQTAERGAAHLHPVEHVDVGAPFLGRDLKALIAALGIGECQIRTVTIGFGGLVLRGAVAIR